MADRSYDYRKITGEIEISQAEYNSGRCYWYTKTDNCHISLTIDKKRELQFSKAHNNSHNPERSQTYIMLSA